MEHAEWIHKERLLWGAVMSPRRKRLTLHGLSGDKRKKAIEKNHQLAADEFAAGWSAYQAWVKH